MAELLPFLSCTQKDSQWGSTELQISEILFETDLEQNISAR